MNYDPDSVPTEHMREGMLAYIQRGILPGSFGVALLENNFARSVGSADVTNTRALREWALWLYNDIPAAAWGSPKMVRAWQLQGGLSGFLPQQNGEQV